LPTPVDGYPCYREPGDDEEHTMTQVDTDPTDDDQGGQRNTGEGVPDPRDTDHAAGDDQASENAENESPG
jgi:hypothetical protein